MENIAMNEWILNIFYYYVYNILNYYLDDFVQQLEGAGMTQEQANQLDFIYDNIEVIISNINTNVGNSKMVLLGIGNSFNISDIVETENISEYSINDFVVASDTTDITTSSVGTNTASKAPRSYYHRVELVSDFVLIYDNTNGNVSIANKQINIHTIINHWSDGAGGFVDTTHTQSISISPKVYLLQKSNL